MFLHFQDHKDINLSSLKAVLVADGANPWSLSSCDQFIATFQSRGLRPEVLCPCAGSSETGMLSLRRYFMMICEYLCIIFRPNRLTPGSSGRGILSMAALSHSVVRVDQENSLQSLTLQDAGQGL